LERWCSVDRRSIGTSYEASNDNQCGEGHSAYLD